MKTLTIKLKAPMMSFGNESKWLYRTTYLMPSKSMVIGLIGAALGYRRGDQRINDLNQLNFAVRADQPGDLMTDYQIVQYRDFLASGKLKNKLEPPKQSYRDYLQNALFMAAVSGNDGFIDQIDHALHHPKFSLYLGRRSCPIAGVIETQSYQQTNPIDVLKNLKWQANQYYQNTVGRDFNHLTIQADQHLVKTGQHHLVKDQVKVNHGRSREFRYRQVVETQVKILR